MPDKLFFCFDSFRLDVHTRVLYRGDDVVRIEPKVVDMLLLLVQRQGMVVSKEELMKHVWAGTVVEESAVRRNISLLRSALDPENTDRYIETLPRQGYRFRVPVSRQQTGDEVSVASVTAAPTTVQSAVNAEPGSSPEAVRPQRNAPVPAGNRQVYYWLGAIVLLVAGAMGYRYLFQPIVHSDVSVRQVTTNSEELPIISGAISPDGRMIAFADETSLFVSDTAALERHALSLPPGVVPSSIEWFNDNMHLLVSGIDSASHETTIWDVPVLGGKVGLLIRNGRMASLSADSQRLVFMRNGNQLWTAGSDGSAQTLFATASGSLSFERPQYSQDGRYILYSVFSEQATESRIEAHNIDSGQVTVLYQAPHHILDFRIINNSELLLTQQMTRDGNASQMLSVAVNIAKGFHSMAHVLASSTDELQTEFNATRDGRTLLTIRSRFFSTVQIADLSGNGTVLGNMRRLTLNDSQNLPSAWLPDSRNVLFFSNRTGHYGIYEQDITAADAHLLVSDQHDYIRPVISADGRWLYYFMPEDVTQQKPDLKMTLMRREINNGSAQIIDTRPDFYRSLRCSPRVNKCVLAEHQNQRAMFYAFDPQQGKGMELASLKWVPAITAFYWDLSADASQIAYLDAAKGTNDIGVIDVQKQPVTSRNIHVPGYDPFATLYWDADDKGFYVSSYNSSGDLLKLLHVDLDGRVDVLRRQPGTLLSWAIPSPDGRHLMFQKFSRKSNIWLLQRQ